MDKNAGTKKLLNCQVLSLIQLTKNESTNPYYAPKYDQF